MALLTLRVLDGADRGRVFRDIPTPLTIGREEGNPIQLNDERISRFHIKVQEDEEKIVLTDLESTNGTKVNGETVQLWHLRPGDVVSVGRSMLLFGTRKEIAERLASLRDADMTEGVALDQDAEDNSASLDMELFFGDDPDAQQTLHTLMPPELPESLTPGQAAQVTEILQFLHLRLRSLFRSVQTEEGADEVVLQQRHWQNLLELQDRLANYLRAIGEPGE